MFFAPEREARGLVHKACGLDPRVLYRGTFFPYTAHEFTRVVDGMNPPGIRSVKPISSILLRSGVATPAATITARSASGFRGPAPDGVSSIVRLRQCRSERM